MNVDKMDRQIDIAELFQKKVSREEMRLNVYDTVLERVHRKIKLVAGVDGGSTFITYVLPEVMIGQPLFNASQCRSYIITSLVKNGFQVKYTHPNLLMISWEHLREKYEKASHVIEEEQQNLIQQHNQKLLQQQKEEEERLNREYMEKHQQIRNFGGTGERDPSRRVTFANDTGADTRRLVRAAEDYVPTGQLRNIYFNRRQTDK
jgi:hypothetical protein